MTRAVTLAEIADTNTFVVDGTNQRVGIASANPTVTLDVGGNNNATGNLTVDGTIPASKLTGALPAISGANLTGVISGVELKQGGSSVGTSITAINFSGATVSAASAGLSTVTVSVSQTLTLGVRVGAAVTFGITGSSFNVSGRGGNVPISV